MPPEGPHWHPAAGIAQRVRVVHRGSARSQAGVAWQAEACPVFDDSGAWERGGAGLVRQLPPLTPWAAMALVGGRWAKHETCGPRESRSPFWVERHGRPMLVACVEGIVPATLSVPHPLHLLSSAAEGVVHHPDRYRPGEEGPPPSQPCAQVQAKFLHYFSARAYFQGRAHPPPHVVPQGRFAPSPALFPRRNPSFGDADVSLPICLLLAGHSLV
mmetsp:Transcript_2025/g.4124  ORF Transcript_2025/g.4124 Transcript_2025/m.4124 type:complete len:215 (-) Transcript_2025:168-812(-)